MATFKQKQTTATKTERWGIGVIMIGALNIWSISLWIQFKLLAGDQRPY